MQITVIGTGYVGLVTGTCLAEFGLSVHCIDNNPEKINQLNAGKVPIYEPNLEAMISRNVSQKRLSFSTDITRAIREAEVVFIAVGTPPHPDGSADTSQVEEVAGIIARNLNRYKVIVNKCTVPVGTAHKIKQIIINHKQENNKSVIARSEATTQSQSSPMSLRATKGSAAIPFDIISNPEFLREGSAVQDFTHPDKIVIGYESGKAKQIMQEIYRPLYLLDTPFVFTNLETAEMIKYACNAFLATKITFINEIANLCDRVGADVHQIAKAMGMDGRISPKFLHPGPGYGGSCFPKDTEAINAIARENDYEFKLIQSVIKANQKQREIVVEKIENSLGSIGGKTIGILGLAFKQNSDDIRESAAIDIIRMLLKKRAKIKAFDPMAMENTKPVLPAVTYCRDEYETAQDADALVILTEWNQFRNLDLNRMKKQMKRHEYGFHFEPRIFDMKNLFEPEKVKRYGFEYTGMGRS